MRQLALSVGHGRRDAIGKQAHAAHAEGGTRTETAYRELRVLRVVLAIARSDPGYSTQRIGDVDADRCCATRCPDGDGSARQWPQHRIADIGRGRPTDQPQYEDRVHGTDPVGDGTPECME